MIEKEKFIDYLKAKGCAVNTLTCKRIHIEQFYFWLMDKEIKDIREVTPKIIRDYQFYLINHHRRKDGKNI